jgi:hypothetical protein
MPAGPKDATSRYSPVPAVAVQYTRTTASSQSRNWLANSIIRARGVCLVRTVKDGKSLYLFRAGGGGKDQDIHTPYAGVRIRRSGLIVLSGADSAGNEYTWDRDLLATRVGELATLEFHETQWLERALEALPEPDYSKPAPKRKGAAA